MKIPTRRRKIWRRNWKK